MYKKRRYKLIVKENFVLYYPDVIGWQVESSETEVTVFSERKNISSARAFWT
jgi:hypothetical protein